MTILEQDTMRAITSIPKELEDIKEALSFITIVLIALSGKGKTELNNDITKAIEILKNKGYPALAKAERNTKMTITKDQLADLINGLGSSYISSGEYIGDRSTTTIGEILKILADDIRDSHTETYEVPPTRKGE